MFRPKRAAVPPSSSSCREPPLLAVPESPLNRLQTIQKCHNDTARQAQLVALVQELQAYCCSKSANHVEAFRVLGYCYDHGMGVDYANPEQAFRLYLKADALLGKKNRTSSSAEWLYLVLQDERVTRFETRFALDQAMERLRAALQRAQKALDVPTVRQAIREELALAFLQGLLRLEEFRSEAALQKKARRLAQRANRIQNDAKRLALMEEGKRVQAQLQKEVEARQAAAEARAAVELQEAAAEAAAAVEAQAAAELEQSDRNRAESASQARRRPPAPEELLLWQ